MRVAGERKVWPPQVMLIAISLHIGREEVKWDVSSISDLLQPLLRLERPEGGRYLAISLDQPLLTVWVDIALKRPSQSDEFGAVSRDRVAHHAQNLPRDLPCLPPLVIQRIIGEGLVIEGEAVPFVQRYLH